MALTVSQVGRVDVPPNFVGLTGAPADLAALVIDFTLVVGTEYSSGISYLSMITAINTAITAGTVGGQSAITSIVGCQINHIFRPTVGYRFGFTVNDNSTGTTTPPNRVRYFVLLTTETAGTEYTPVALDVVRTVIYAI